MVITPKGAFCDYDHATQYGQEAGRKLRQSTERAEKKAVKADKQANRKALKDYREKDHSYQFKLTKKAAQALANALDAKLPCICCDTPRGKQQFCGGHFKTGKAHPELSLSLLNIHGQANRNCNEGKSGNINGDKHSKGYKQGLIDRYGQWLVDYLESYHPPRKFTCEELIAMRKEFAAETRRLKKGLPPSRNWRSLPVIT